MGEVLPECTTGFHDVRLEIGVIKTELKTHEKVIDKLTEGFEKIQEVNTNLLRMLAIHEEKHENHDKVNDDMDDDLKDLHSRITTESRITEEKFTRLESEVHAKIDSLKNEIMVALPTIKEDVKSSHKVVDVIKELDSWKYIIVTVFVVLVWIIEHVNLSALAKLFSGN